MRARLPTICILIVFCCHGVKASGGVMSLGRSVEATDRPPSDLWLDEISVYSEFFERPVLPRFGRDLESFPGLGHVPRERDTIQLQRSQPTSGQPDSSPSDTPKPVTNATPPPGREVDATEPEKPDSATNPSPPPAPPNQALVDASAERFPEQHYREGSPGSLIAVLLCCFIGGLVYWFYTGFLRVFPGECYRVLYWLGAQEIVVGPRWLYRPWPLYRREQVFLGPRGSRVDAVQPLTSDGFRPELHVFVVFSITDPNALSTRQDTSHLVCDHIRSAFTQCVGELDLATFVSRQRWVSERVGSLVQDHVNRWGINLHSVEVTHVGRIAFSSARTVLGRDSEFGSRMMEAHETNGKASIVRAI